MYKLHNNPVLYPHQIKILTQFFNSSVGKQFYLTGGTALAAFYLGHRRSEDLDLFTLKPFDTVQLNQIIKTILTNTSSKIKRQIKTPQYWELYVKSTSEDWVQRIDFVQEQPVVFGKQKIVDKIVVDNIENMASNKILSVYERFEPKRLS